MLVPATKIAPRAIFVRFKAIWRGWSEKISEAMKFNGHGYSTGST